MASTKHAVRTPPASSARRWVARLRARRWPTLVTHSYEAIRGRTRWIRRRVRACRKCLWDLLFSKEVPLRQLLSLDRETVKKYIQQRFQHFLGLQPRDAPTEWFQSYRLSPRQLRRFRKHCWPAEAPTFTVVIYGPNIPSDILAKCLRSVHEQTYTRFNYLCQNDGVPLQLSRVQCDSDFVCYVNGHGLLEPQALHRFAETICRNQPDVLYADEITVSADGRDVLDFQTRPAFSYDYYLSHSYFSNLVAIRTKLLDSNDLKFDLEMILRVFENARSVSHIPDLLYQSRYRNTPTVFSEASSYPHQPAQRTVHAHLARLGWNATVTDIENSPCRMLHFPSAPHKVAIIIPTKNQKSLLERCISSVEKTQDLIHADIYVVDHESDDQETQHYLLSLQNRHHVLHYQGNFNFSTIMNQTVAQLQGDYSHYLFLNNDTEALTKNWLDHMIGYATRPDIAIVGPLLIYPDGTTQHGGVVVGTGYSAVLAYNGLQAISEEGQRLPGPNMSFLTVREQSAVCAACLLMRADVFQAIGGYDETLAVGFGDVDLCLRAGQMGQKVLLDGHVVFRHDESASRGKDNPDPHPRDTELFRKKHLRYLIDNDLYYSPLRWRQSHLHMAPFLRANRRIYPRTVPLHLPRKVA